MPAPTSNSSVSPARRADFQRSSFPFAYPPQHPFLNPQVLQSPQSYSNDFGQPGMYATPAAQMGRRTRAGAAYPTSAQSLNTTPGTGNGSGILPTPDPTVGSCMSEEDKDVALQLMRLGDMSNISHGRTSASTLDDTFSGRAAASSTGATSDEESDMEVDLPPPREPKRESSPIMPPGSIKRFRKHLDDILPSQDTTEPSGDEYEDGDQADGTFKPETHEDFISDLAHTVRHRDQKMSSHPPGKARSVASSHKSTNKTSKPAKTHRASIAPKTKAKVGNRPAGSKPISPTSLPPQSRKASVASAINFQHQLADDEDDLSSKPRCQRCRKSKKGCNRKRPCQRCSDAGLGIDQCISEDEGNGRKGRYGRHMGVSIKKDELGNVLDQSIMHEGLTATGMASPDKSKKRKR